MDLNLSGKNAIVCGSSQGIGKAVAIELALLGANVTLLARNEELLRQVLTELDRSKGQEHSFEVADFSFPEKVATVAGQIALKREIHILVNNTGGPPAGPVISAETSAFLAAFNSHLICNHLLVQAFTPGMKKAAYGRIINIISTSVRQPLKGLGVSNTIRGAVASWAKTLSFELAQHGITVNNVLPGATGTQRLTSIIQNKASKTGTEPGKVEQEMLEEIPAGRFGTPAEIAALAAFLACPAASYVNGQSIAADGGRTSAI